MVLLCNDVSHWLGASLESALKPFASTNDVLHDNTTSSPELIIKAIGQPIAPGK